MIALTAHVQPALVIWIAKEFSQSHRQVFEWLDQTLEHLIDWVSVEFELWRIDDSPPCAQIFRCAQTTRTTYAVRHTRQAAPVAQECRGLVAIGGETSGICGPIGKVG
ncbi:MAG: hypothetical protein D6690_04705 [Nitrospirae bacterium]|nr:MAG: hypothetical protein D6690_04705 [Nitrospirota bacterium]